MQKLCIHHKVVDIIYAQKVYFSNLLPHIQRIYIHIYYAILSDIINFKRAAGFSSYLTNLFHIPMPACLIHKYVINKSIWVMLM
jgi:hypothetical protein